MDTVVKSMLDDDQDDQKKVLFSLHIFLPAIMAFLIFYYLMFIFKIGLVIFGRDVSKIPCFRESFLYGIATGIGFSLVTFIKTSKPMLSQHVGVGMFSMSTLIYWSFCRYQWSKQRFDAQLLQEALKDKILQEGTAAERELERKGVLKSA